LGETDLRLFGCDVLKLRAAILYFCVFIIICLKHQWNSGKVFEKDLVGRAADNMRKFVTFECF